MAVSVCGYAATFILLHPLVAVVQAATRPHRLHAGAEEADHDHRFEALALGLAEP